MSKNLQNVIQHTEVSVICKAFFYVDCRQYKKFEENFSFLTNFMEENLPSESRIPSVWNLRNCNKHERKQTTNFPFIWKYQKL